MISSSLPQNQHSGCIKNCTTASTFEKPKSLKFEILFGDSCGNKTAESSDARGINAIDYLFAPGQLFGFAYESMGVDYKRMHHAFILRTCSPGEKGHHVMGISPGAEIIVKTLSDVGSKRLRALLQKLEKNKVVIPELPISNLRRLNDLLEIKTNVNYFVGELEPELFEAVQQILRKNAKYNHRIYENQRTYFLSGILFDQDGNSLHGESAKNKKNFYYVNRKKNYRIRAKLIEKEVIKYLGDGLKKNGLFEQKLKELFGGQQRTSSDYGKSILGERYFA